MLLKLYGEFVAMVIRAILMLSALGGGLAARDYYRAKAGEAVNTGLISLRSINNALFEDNHKTIENMYSKRHGKPTKANYE